MHKNENKLDEMQDIVRILHQYGRTPSKRLEGLIPNMEFFHLHAEWNLIWKCSFKTTPHKDIGTLYAA